jgi:multidrug resistance efflux pump
MKINLLYLLIPIALGTCYYIVQDLQGQNGLSFVGTAETEPTVISLDQDIEVVKVFVQTGAQVRAGDTLAIFFRREIEIETQKIDAEIRQDAIELSGKAAMLNESDKKLEANFQAKIADFRAEMAALQSSDSLESALKNALFPGVKTRNQAVERKIAAIQESISFEQKIYAQDRARLRAEQQVNNQNSGSKQAYGQTRRAMQERDRARLVLIAPVSGYIDQLNISLGAQVQAYREMLRIFPTKANKCIGFIHENAVVPFHIGDTVYMASSTRPLQKAQGRIVAASPKLVELPLRLRKFIEVRAWGREVIIQMDGDNEYYIGEKIAISLNAPVQ